MQTRSGYFSVAGTSCGGLVKASCVIRHLDAKVKQQSRKLHGTPRVRTIAVLALSLIKLVFLFHTDCCFTFAVVVCMVNASTTMMTMMMAMMIMSFVLLLHVVIQKGGSRFSTVVTIVVLRHEATDTRHGRILSQSRHLAVGFHSVILERLQRNRLVRAFDLFGTRVDLLLAFLATAPQTQHQVERRFLLDVVVAQRSSVFQLLSSKNQTLLIRGDPLLVLNFGFDIVNGIGWFDVQCNGLACFRRTNDNVMV